jgi:parvulin-like peptidyl-prolyl isomerase
VAGTPIGAAALQAELKRQFRPGDGPISTDQKLAALDRLIRNEVLYARALEEGFDQTPEMQTRIKNLVIGHFKERHLPNGTNAITDQAIHQYYEANAQRYAQAGAVRGAMIFLPMPSSGSLENQNELRRQAEAILEEARQAIDDRAFAQVVLRCSADQATRYRGGEAGWLTAQSEGEGAQLFEALAALETPGQFAPLVTTARGIYVVKLLEKRARTQRPLAEVKETIRYQLTRQQTEQAEHDFMTGLKAGLDVQINRPLVESISGPAPTPAPPSMPGGVTAQIR